MRYTRKKLSLIVALIVVLAVASFLTWRLLPMSADGMRRSAVIVEETTWQEVTADGKPCLYIASVGGDGLLVGVTSLRDSALHRHYATGFWYSRSWAYPSCRGRVATAYVPRRSAFGHAADTLLLRLCKESVDRELKALGHQKEELDYYMRSHGVQDHGYQQIAALATRVSRAYVGVTRARDILDSLARGSHRLAIRQRSEYVAVYRDGDGSRRRIPLRVSMDDTSRDGMTVMRTADGSTPSGVTSLYRLPFTSRRERDIRAVGFPSIGERGLECDTVSPQIIPGRELSDGRHDLPSLLAGDGAPVFTKKGRYVGYVKGMAVE